MKIEQLSSLVPAAPISTEITYLVFGGQGSVYISRLEYCPAKKQVKLLSEPQGTYRGPVTLGDLLIYPPNTEILIEGYPGNEDTQLQWVTPDNVEYTPDTGNIDFQRLLREEETTILNQAMKEIYGIVDTLKGKDIPNEIIQNLLKTFEV